MSIEKLKVYKVVSIAYKMYQGVEILVCRSLKGDDTQPGKVISDRIFINNWREVIYPQANPEIYLMNKLAR